VDFGERKSLVFERWSGDRDRASPRAEGGRGEGERERTDVCTTWRGMCRRRRKWGAPE